MRSYESEIADEQNRTDEKGKPLNKALVKRLKQEWDEYKKRMEKLLPAHIYALHFARLDDALVRRIIWDRRERTLKLLLRVDDNNGRFDVNIHYSGVELERGAVRNLHRAVRNKDVEFLYGQIGFANKDVFMETVPVTVSGVKPSRSISFITSCPKSRNITRQSRRTTRLLPCGIISSFPV